MNQVAMDFQEVHTTNFNLSYGSSVSHPILKEWSIRLG